VAGTALENDIEHPLYFNPQSTRARRNQQGAPRQRRRPHSIMQSLSHITSLAQVIQLAVAPVFLLTGVAGILNVLANRIGRIIDRARPMEERLATVDLETARDLHARLKVLSRRAAFINRAIGLCVLSGLLVSIVVAALFVSSSLQLDLAAPISVTFVVALFSLAVSLVYFLREVFLATTSLSFGGVRKTAIAQD
jgi:hypothetical protein